jgi:tRNA threonylcarbamoyladenosine biosynthesis protein TsaB
MKNSYLLKIDSSKKDVIQVGITGENVSDIRKINNNFQSSQVILPAIETLLRDNNIGMNEIYEVRVDLGPGSFTGLRIGLVIARTVSLLLGIPWNGNASHVNPEVKYDPSRFDTFNDT